MMTFGDYVQDKLSDCIQSKGNAVIEDLSGPCKDYNDILTAMNGWHESDSMGAKLASFMQHLKSTKREILIDTAKRVFNEYRAHLIKSGSLK